ncbi:MAG TPA: bacteriohopanetetrol glucosamine biosynthesis glycosyltransferase HpnI [Steroidobacteraceae bacterium]|nr:bacteriohopanetetrol glucosamine biosynthesis glycosyltransferase HpnI [Steroidobacteraceae bacterium]
MPLIRDVTLILGLAALGAAAAYALIALIATVVWKLRRPEEPNACAEPVSILKPLCGAEPGLYEQLASFCRQDYPAYEVIFGIREPGDPARAVVERLAVEFPGVPIRLVSDPRLHGSNYKVSNLINMLDHARHDLLAVSDSDARVGPDYLARVTAPLADRRVGLITSLYRAVPTPGIWSRVGAMYINEWYMPCVRLAWMFGHRGYVSGQTMCLRRSTLDAGGGLAALANHLPEDHRLGELVHTQGLSVQISSYPVVGEHHEPSYRSLAQHELRWMRTLRVLKPQGFAWLFLTFSLPLALLGLALVHLGAPSATASRTALGLLAAALACRLALHGSHRPVRERRMVADLWLLPLRDLLLCWVWTRAFVNTRVTWRGHEFTVDPGGLMRRMS